MVAHADLCEELQRRGVLLFSSECAGPDRLYEYSKWILSLVPEDVQIRESSIRGDYCAFVFDVICCCEGEERCEHPRPNILVETQGDGLGGPPVVDCSLFTPELPSTDSGCLFNEEGIDNDDDIKKYIPRYCRFIATRGAACPEIGRGDE